MPPSLDPRSTAPPKLGYKDSSTLSDRTSESKPKFENASGVHSCITLPRLLLVGKLLLGSRMVKMNEKMVGVTMKAEAGRGGGGAGRWR